MTNDAAKSAPAAAPAAFTMLDDSTAESDASTGLLPAGLRDVLPPRAEWEAEVTGRLMGAFAARGYQRVKPPLIEFEEGLLAGVGSSLSSQMFRVMDPVSRRMMGVRTDITVQVARIAETRLKGEPRPLRLSYNGQVLRVEGSQLRPERQFAEVGVELIGSDNLAADIEVATLGVEALLALGIRNLSLDLIHPRLVPAICSSLGMGDTAAQAARKALDRKDAAALRDAAGRHATVLQALLDSSGPAEAAFAKLDGLDLPQSARGMIDAMRKIAEALRVAAPGLLVTVDACEFRGFDYHSGVAFSLFARGVRGELGRGGRYVSSSDEPATGFTLYLDSLMRALPPAPRRKLVFLPYGTPAAEGEKLRADGEATLAGLDPKADPAADARRLACTHILRNGRVSALEPNS